MKNPLATQVLMELRLDGWDMYTLNFPREGMSLEDLSEKAMFRYILNMAYVLTRQRKRLPFYDRRTELMDDLTDEELMEAIRTFINDRPQDCPNNALQQHFTLWWPLLLDTYDKWKDIAE